jgi:hypothetical protein
MYTFYIEELLKSLLCMENTIKLLAANIQANRYFRYCVWQPCVVRRLPELDDVGYFCPRRLYFAGTHCVRRNRLESSRTEGKDTVR